MNRLEQIIEASKSNLEKKDDEILHVYDRHAGFIEGAEWADNTMIEKACEWLKGAMLIDDIYGVGDNIENLKELINDFRKAMEGGEK